MSPHRKVVTVLPAFRVRAMPMESLAIDGARVASMPMDMVDLTLVRLVEEPSTGGAASALVFDPGGPSRTARRGRPSSGTPIEFIPITPLAAPGSDGLGRSAGHNRVPSREREPRPSAA